MPVYSVTRKSQSWYGTPVGILILNACYPCIPGNVGNATSFPFPVRYKEVSEASINGLINRRDPALIEPFVRGAKELEAEGVLAIAGACGFMALFQREVAEAVQVPVCLSSLLQIPFIRQILPQGKKIGVITANAGALTERHFRAVGVEDSSGLVIQGLEGSKEFREAILEEKGTLDSERMEQEVVQAAEAMAASNPGLGSIVLECSDLPPFARAVQDAVRLPVFDFNTMIRHLQTAVVQQPYQGYM
ncbi:MAG: aspartate/glutamate racemase family protein [Desulfohalobiaceae bacterium]|nr:aspartate/glutamate racemase family protein [Desulfohalobiaceae bacterium]